MEKLVFVSIKIYFWLFIGILLKFLLSKIDFVNSKKIYGLFSTFVVYIFTPYFVGIKIWTSYISKEVFFSIITVFLIVIFVSYIISKFLLSRQDFVFQEMFFTLSFMNTIYLGIPVTEYFVSQNVVNYTIIYSIIVTLIQFTLGIYMLAPSLKFIYFLFTSPIVYVSVLGYLLKINNVSIPEYLLTINNFLSKIISPLMLIFIGSTLRLKNVFEHIRVHIFVTIARIIFIFVITICTFLVIKNFISLQKEFVKVLVLVSILPSAIMNYILLDKFKFDTKFVLGEIFWGTIVTIFLLPYISEVLDIILLALF